MTKNISRSLIGWTGLHRMLDKGSSRRSFAGKFLSNRSRVIQTARTSPQRRQRVKRRKRILVARKQRISRALVSAAKFALLMAVSTILMMKVIRYMYSSPSFAIAHIAVTGNAHVTARQVIDESGITEGNNIFRVSLSDSAEAIEKIPWVHVARVDRFLPNEIKIEVTERKPIALVLSQKLFLIDEEAIVVAEFDASEKPDAPIITARAMDTLNPGDVIKLDGISEALEIVRLMSAMNLQESISISEICIDRAPRISLVAERSGAHIVLGVGDLEGKLWRLAIIVTAINGDEHLRAASLEKMDMRFQSIVPTKFRDS